MQFTLTLIMPDNFSKKLLKSYSFNKIMGPVYIIYRISLTSGLKLVPSHRGQGQAKERQTTSD